MTSIYLRCKIEHPTEKVNEETIQPLLKVFRKSLKEFLESNGVKKVTVGRVSKAKKNRMKKTIQCLICRNNFTTIMTERKLCSECVRVARGIGVNANNENPDGEQQRYRRRQDVIEYFDRTRRRYVPL